MKKKLLLLLISLLITINTSHGQTSEPPAETYSISPTTWREYYSWLKRSTAPNKESTLEEVENKFVGKTDVIKSDGTVGSCIFYLDVHRMDDIITSVPSQDAQQLFTQWRKNPTLDDAIAYLYDKYKTSSPYSGGASPSEKTRCISEASLIRSRYPDAPQHVMEDPSVLRLGTVFDDIDTLVKTPRNNCVYEFFDDLSLPALAIVPSNHLYDLKDSYNKGKASGDPTQVIFADRDIIVQGYILKFINRPGHLSRVQH